MIPKVLVAALFYWLSTSAFAGPYELSYGGRLTGNAGKPVAGPVALRVTFFRSALGSDQIAVALPDFTNIALQDGVFKVTINLSASDFHTVFNGTDATYIQIEDLTHDVIYPRQVFSAVPYALKIPVDGESITYNENGQLALGNGSNILKLPNSAGAVDKVLKSDGAGALVWADDLSGGAAGSITSTEIQDGTITNADVSATAAIDYLKISGLGTAANKNVGAAAGDVAAGNHTHVLSAITDAGSLASKSVVGSSDITDGAVTGTDIASGTITNTNISASAAIDNSKIAGLGTAATKNVGTAASEVAAGDHSHGDATTVVSGFMSAADKVRLNAAVVTTDTNTVTSTMIADTTIVNADVSATAAIAGSKINPNFGAQNVSTTGSVTAGAFVGDGSGLTNLPAGSLGTSIDSSEITDGEIVNADISATAAIATSKLSGAVTGISGHGLGSLATKSAVDSSDITDGQIANIDVSATAAIAGSKINPNFGAQNVSTTGSVTAGAFVGDGSGLTNLPAASVGLTSCPSGFSMVGSSGQRGNFCIDTNERTAVDTYFDAKSACHNLSHSQGKATLCSHSEWYEACVRGSASGMTGNYEWVAALSYDPGNTHGMIAGFSSCTSITAGAFANDYPFRCCIR